LIAAQDWYDTEGPGLRRRFRSEVDGLIAGAFRAPLHFLAVRGSFRRATVRHFPYALFFTLTPDAILVIACFHGSREAAIWQRRERRIS
jgi:toxin ParE1/3/4